MSNPIFMINLRINTVKVSTYSLVAVLLVLVLSFIIKKVDAQETTDSLIASIQNSKLPADKAFKLIELSDFYASSKQFALSNKYLKKSARMALLIKEDKPKAQAMFNIGLKYKQKNQFIDAASIMEEALVFAKRTNDSLLICNLSNALGVSYRRIDNDSKAMQHHLRALDLSILLNNLKNQSTALNGIGIILNYQNKYDEALRHFESAIIIERKRKSHTGIAINYNCIAWAYSLKGDHTKAIEYYEKSIAENKKINNDKGIAICLTDLGKEYVILEKYEMAMNYYQDAQKIFTSLNETNYLASTHFYLGELYLKTKRFPYALKYLKQALQTAEKNHNSRLQKKSLELMAKVYFELGYFSHAYENILAAYKLKDIIYNEQSKAIIEETEAKYNLRKTREEMKLLEKNNHLTQETINRQRVLLILLGSFIGVVIFFMYIIALSRKRLKISQINLKKQNISIEKQRDKIDKQRKELEANKKELEAINASKDKFFSIIAHDLRNPFNALLSLTGVMIEEYKDLTETEVKDMLETINDSANRGYNLLENLLLWSRTQLGGLKINPSLFSLKKLCDEIIDEINLSAKSKAISINNLSKEEHCAFADRNMMSVVIRNLLSNAIKFTNEKGKIDISSQMNEKNCNVCIKDNGTGIPKEDLDKIFKIESNYSRKGTKKEKGSGLGLIIVKEFMKKNSGSISVVSEINKGSEFCITLPSSA